MQCRVSPPSGTKQSDDAVPYVTPPARRPDDAVPYEKRSTSVILTNPSAPINASCPQFCVPDGLPLICHPPTTFICAPLQPHARYTAPHTNKTAGKQLPKKAKSPALPPMSRFKSTNKSCILVTIYICSPRKTLCSYPCLLLSEIRTELPNLSSLHPARQHVTLPSHQSP